MGKEEQSWGANSLSFLNCHMPKRLDELKKHDELVVARSQKKPPHLSSNVANWGSLT